MNLYRVKFFEVKGLLRNRIDTTADKAALYQIFLNNKKQGEFKNLKAAIEFIIENEGQDQELQNLIENLCYVQNPTANFTTAGITYTQKHGVRIEQIIRDKKSGGSVVVPTRGL
jgi:hypothetical protein